MKYVLQFLNFILQIFLKNHRIVNKNEYIDVEQFKKNSKFENGIYIENDTDEKYCSTCLDSNRLLVHLVKVSDVNGTVYVCNHCNARYFHENYNPNRYNSGDGFMTW